MDARICGLSLLQIKEGVPGMSYLLTEPDDSK